MLFKRNRNVYEMHVLVRAVRVCFALLRVTYSSVVAVVISRKYVTFSSIGKLLKLLKQ